jgi:hypothetical protein
MDSKHCLKTAHKMLHKGSRKHQTLQKVELDIEVFKRLDKDEYNTYRIWLLLDCDRTSDSKILINEDLRKKLNICRSHLYSILKKGNGIYWIVCKSKYTRQGFIVLKSRKGVLRSLGIEKGIVRKLKVVTTQRQYIQSFKSFNNLIISIHAEIKNIGTYNETTQKHKFKGKEVSGKSYERIANKTKFSYSKVSKTLVKHKGKVKRYERVDIGNKNEFRGIREARKYLKKITNTSDYLDWITTNGKQGLFIKRVGGKFSHKNIGKNIDTTHYILARRIANEFKQTYIKEIRSVIAPSSKRNDLMSAFSDINKGICNNAEYINDTQ